MVITKAQGELLTNLENGWEITFKDGHYTQVKDNMASAKLWPSTFYGLFDQRFVVKSDNGNYTISSDGIRQIRGKDE